MRFARLLLVLAAIATAGPALAEEPAAQSSVVILRGSSAPPTPWYEPPPEPKVATPTVYVPLYYPVLLQGAPISRWKPGPIPARRR